MQNQPALTILYVANPAASIAFYSALFGIQPVESSENFAMFKTPGIGIAIWRASAVEPAVSATPGASELVIMSPDADAAHAEWQSRGIRIIAAPFDAGFGRSFMAADPDGHRLRVLTPS